MLIVQSCKNWGAEVEDASQTAFVDQLLGERDGRDTAIVVPDHVGNARPFDGGNHLFAFSHVHGQRLFAQDHLARGGGGQGDFLMDVVRRANIDRVDIVALQQFLPIGFDRGITPGLGELRGLGLVAGAHGLQHRPVFGVEEVAHAVISVRVRPAHKAVADHADTNGLRHINLDGKMSGKESGKLKC